MVIFKLLTDIVANAGILLFVWEMVRVARTLSRPDPDGVEQILGALKRLQVIIDRLSTRLGKVVHLPGSEEQHENSEAANE
jgi:hypothetical protein